MVSCIFLTVRTLFFAWVHESDLFPKNTHLEMVNLEGNKKTQHSSPLWLFCNIMHFSGMERENEKKNV